MDCQAATTQSPLFVSNGVWSSVIVKEDENSKTVIERLDWDSKSLRPYGKFKKLYAERKWAKRYPEKLISRITFFDLPPELRNTIYHLALLPAPAYIDFCPKTNQDGPNGNAKHHHMKRFGKEVLPSLGLLRTCKQINIEGSDIFYGEIDWRFTQLKGKYILDAWLRQIGPANQARITKLTMHVPWAGNVKESYLSNKDDLPESQRRLDSMRGQIRRMGLTVRKWDRAMAESACIKRTFELLKKHGNLKTLRLILPDSYDLTAGWTPTPDYNEIFDPTKLGIKELKVQLVSLQGGMQQENRDPQDLKGCRMRVLRSQAEAFKEAGEKGWEVVVEGYDEMGYYPVAMAAGMELAIPEPGDDDEDS